MADPKKVEQMAAATTETANKLEQELSKNATADAAVSDASTPPVNIPVMSETASQQPKPLSNGLYLLVFDKPWNGYNAKEQAAFDKARAELLVSSKIARYVPEKTA